MTRIDPGEQFERALREHKTRVDIGGDTWVKLTPGTVLMPRVASPAMVAAAQRCRPIGDGGPRTAVDFAEVYRAMIGARPTIPV